MYPVTHFRWRVKAFFSRAASTARRKKIRRVKINADKANESFEQFITRKRKKYEKRRRRFRGGSVESPIPPQQNLIHAPTKDYKGKPGHSKVDSKAEELKIQPYNHEIRHSSDATKIIKGAFLHFEQEALQLWGLFSLCFEREACVAKVEVNNGDASKTK